MAQGKRVRIDLLGGPTAVRDGVRFAPSALLVRLAADHPQPVKRAALLESLYPEADAAARNRLRVALTRLRSTVPLIETDDRVGLSPTEVEVDLHEIKAELENIRLEPSEDEEAAHLQALLPTLSLLLFPDASTEWELAAQSDWSKTAIHALNRLGEIAERSFDSETAAQAAKAALNHYPYDPEAWARRMRSMTKLGEAGQAAIELAAARRRAKAEGWPFPEELEGWDQSGEDQSLGPSLSLYESHALERFFRRALASEPAAAIEVLGSSSFRPEVIRDPRSTLPLLLEALTLETPHSEAKERVQVRVITALNLLEEWERVLSEVDRFLQFPIGPARRRIALLSGSFASAMVGKLDQAVQMVDDAMVLATGVNAEYDRSECIAQRASFLMFRGEFDAAEADLRQALDTLRAHAREGSEPDLLSIQSNLGLCLLATERSQEALQILRPVVEAARRANLPAIIGLSAPILALAEASQGEAPHGLMVEGLRAAFRTSPRQAVFANALAGKSLTLLGRPEGESVVQEALAHRQSRPTPLNALESWIFSPPHSSGGGGEGVRPLAEFTRATIRLCAKLGERR